MFHDKRRGSWRVQWTQLGKRQSRTFHSKAEAKLFEAEMQSGMVVTPAYSTETLSDFAGRWLTDYSKVEKAASQYVNDESVVRNVVRPSAVGAMRMTAIRKSDVLTFRRELKDRRHLRTGNVLSVKTLNHALALVKKILATAVEWDVLVKNPAAGVKLFPQPEQAFAYWTAEERDRFIRFARQHDPTFTELVTVASHTGLRRGELAALRRHQLDFDQRMILVNASFCFQTNQRIEVTKNKSVAWVPMDGAVREALADRRLLAPEAQVFSPSDLLHASKRLRRLCAVVGSKPIRFHDLRHSYASCLAMAGVGIYTVQQLMRHKSPLMTGRYAHLSAHHLHEAASRLDARAVARGDFQGAVTRESL